LTHTVQPLPQQSVGSGFSGGIGRGSEGGVTSAGSGRCALLSSVILEVLSRHTASSDRAATTTGRRAPPLYTRTMDYQLVIKLWRASLTDEAFLATVEDDLTAALGTSVELEGFDVGAKEINFFMLTADPRPVFRKARDVFERHGVTNGLSAAYRLNGGAQFTSVWPLRPMRKFKLP
jgi:hypothetical protein